jgi:EAL domain-containing protein (putative c-di-GMP-specific phosphodiesterase class I)
MKFDIVKIDGGYVRNILDNSSDQVFIEALSSIAKYHDLLIVAEMGDSDEAAALLRTLGVDTFQGFHFGRPEIAPDWLGRDAADRIVRSIASR